MKPFRELTIFEEPLCRKPGKNEIQTRFPTDTSLTLYIYNFCWPVRTLAVKDDRGRKQKRSPAMAAELTDHIWTMAEWFAMPAVRRC